MGSLLPDIMAEHHLLLLPLLCLLCGSSIAADADKEQLEKFNEEYMCLNSTYYYSHEVLLFMDYIFYSGPGMLQFLWTIKDLDLQKDNFFKELHSFIMLQRRSNFGYIGTNLEYFACLGGYFKYMTLDQDENYDNNCDDNFGFIPNMERSGTFEEYILYITNTILKSMEAQADSGCNSSYPDLNAKLDQIKARLGIWEEFNDTGIDAANDDDLFSGLGYRSIYPESYKFFTTLPVIPFYSYTIQELFTYDSRPEWNEWAADKLATAVKNMAFFGKLKVYSSEKAKEYLEYGLPGGRDPLTFILQRPNVLKSPKIEPALRMALARFVGETKNFDQKFFRTISCIINKYSYGITHIFGWNQEDLTLLIKQIQDNYEEGIHQANNTPQDPEVWMDFMDALLVQMERIDVDQIFYEFYAILLKSKLFLERIDFDGKMGPLFDQILANLEQPYVLLTCGKWPSLLEAIKKAADNIKEPKFWKPLNDAFKKFGKYLTSIRVSKDFMDYLQNTLEEIDKTVGIWYFFKTETTDSGKKYFKATQFFKQYQKNNSNSIFQPNFEFIDFKKWIKSAARTIPIITEELEPSFNALVEDIDMTPVDLGMVKEIKERFFNLTQIVRDRVELTE